MISYTVWSPESQMFYHLRTFTKKLFTYHDKVQSKDSVPLIQKYFFRFRTETVEQIISI